MRVVYRYLTFAFMSLALTPLFAAEKEFDGFENAQTLTLEEVKEALHKEIEPQISDEFEIDLRRHPFPVEIQSDEPLDIKIVELKLNAQKNRFSFKLALGNYEAAPLLLSGIIVTLLEVPVLNRQIGPQDMIKEEDIIWTKVPSQKINHTTITSIESLIGSQPKGAILRANVPLRSSDIKRPQAVKRGAIVSLVVKTAKMTLETKGKALEDGEMGSTIKISNLDSNRVVRGIVKENNYAEVQTTTVD